MAGQGEDAVLSESPASTFGPLPRRAGKLCYRRRDGGIWGAERWSVMRAADGGRTLAAECEMAFGPDHVVRHSTLSVDASFQPLDAFVRILNRGQLTGTGWFRFGTDAAECESWTIAEGRISQRMPIRRPMRGFGLHALMSDGWMAATFPYEKGAGHLHRWETSLLHSLHHFGATGPMLTPSTSGLRLEGRETIEVPAGRFDCHRLSFAGMTNAHPPYVMWVSADGDFLYVKGDVGGYMDSVFELVELEGGPLG